MSKEPLAPRFMKWCDKFLDRYNRIISNPTAHLILGVFLVCLVVPAFLSRTPTSQVAQAQAVQQAVAQQDTFVWPKMKGAEHLGNGVYKYLLKPLDFGQDNVGPDDFAKDLVTFKGAHSEIRITAVAAINAMIIVNCEWVGK